MHCRSCELVVEKNLKSIPGVLSASVDHKRGFASVKYEGAEPARGALESAVSKSGYTLTDTPAAKAPWVSWDYDNWVDLGASFTVVALAFFVLKWIGLFDISLSVGSAPGLASILLIGLVAGVSTCMAVIGGLVLSISARHAEVHPEASRMQKFRPHLFFNAGRLVSFALLGGTIGIVGSALHLSSVAIGVITLILGVVMLILGLKLTELFPRFTASTFTLPSGIARRLGIHENAEYSHTGAFITGALTFFLPCGFTQAMQLLAIASGSFVSGALIMTVFALGTLPGLIGIGGITSLVQGQFARYFYKGAAVIVIALAYINITAGAALLGIQTPSLSRAEAAPVEIVDGVQIIRMEQTADGYKPDHIVIKKGIPVKWIITSKYQYTCAAQFAAPSLGINSWLQSGDNEFEFTPDESGTIPFSCSMGMYRGTVTVVD